MVVHCPQIWRRSMMGFNEYLSLLALWKTLLRGLILHCWELHLPPPFILLHRPRLKMTSHRPCLINSFLANSTIGIPLQSWPLHPPLSDKTPWYFNKAIWVSHMVYTPSMQCLVYKTKKLLSYARCESVATAAGGGLEVMWNSTQRCFAIAGNDRGSWDMVSSRTLAQGSTIHFTRVRSWYCLR